MNGAVIGHLDAESFLNNIGAEINEDQAESVKATGAKVRSHAEKIKEKRSEQLENIKEQMKAAEGSKGCIKGLISIFKVFDILLKPLSMISGGKIKLELGRSLENIQKMKDQAQELGLQADGKELGKGIQELKQFLIQDLDRAKERDEISDKETRQILKILDDIEATLSTGMKN